MFTILSKLWINVFYLYWSRIKTLHTISQNLVINEVVYGNENFAVLILNFLTFSFHSFIKKFDWNNKCKNFDFTFETKRIYLAQSRAFYLAQIRGICWLTSNEFKSWDFNLNFICFNICSSFGKLFQKLFVRNLLTKIVLHSTYRKEYVLPVLLDENTVV